MFLEVMYDNFFREVKILLIIIYARLSKEERGKSEEEQSQSIQNQLEICREYIEDEMQEYPDIQFKIVDELWDDGVSGTTFDRDGFNEAIKKLETGKANMLITKDLSRFGREHINSDTYIEKWFPEHNIRYVAILDGVDTYVPDNVNNDMTPMKTWMNEMYAKNTSRSVKKTFKSKMKKGIWTGGEPPLGLQIDPENKGKLILEPKGAEIVKRIFDLALENKSLDTIADILINDKVPIPTIIKGNKRNLDTNLIELWSPDTIREILQNEMYLGYMIQGKTTKLSYKSKKIIYLPKEDWIKVPNKVPVIIEQTQFDSVQLLIKSNKNKNQKSHDYLLKGMLKCAECNHTIGIRHYDSNRQNKTICSYYRKYGKKVDVCTEHKFIYEEVEQSVLQSIKNECLQYVDSTNFEDKLKDKAQSKKAQTDLKLKIDKSKREIAKLEKSMDKAYKRLDAEIIDEDQYARLVKGMREDIEYQNKNIERYNKDLQGLIEKNIIEPEYSKIVKEFLALKEPNKILITKLIDVIYIDENGTLDIHYKVQNPYKK